jgi:hypothetical protein
MEYTVRQERAYRVDFGSLPRYPGGTDDASADPGPPPDRHSVEYAIGVLLVVAAVGVVAFVALVALLLLSGVGAGPVFA